MPTNALAKSREVVENATALDCPLRSILYRRVHASRVGAFGSLCKCESTKERFAAQFEAEVSFIFCDLPFETYENFNILNYVK